MLLDSWTTGLQVRSTLGMMHACERRANKRLNQEQKNRGKKIEAGKAEYNDEACPCVLCVAWYCVGCEVCSVGCVLCPPRYCTLKGFPLLSKGIVLPGMGDANFFGRKSGYVRSTFFTGSYA